MRAEGEGAAGATPEAYPGACGVTSSREARPGPVVVGLAGTHRLLVSGLLLLPLALVLELM
eukprot:CAMPEP_0202922320 /NCGR_PEP_ID=MMETSP1392-20130828/77860_1 /ASSEMBLY_ACC=CAM_ASM_000868 /TAXON_ID=225041 /ORGANISM="Chlamydomonas chlamydogama, Strain SAG 11-48b" /LENGTH=60 /DNA_ID=CAMNT_0049615939 /DNA_START=283 /DNA_END=465 /DNA_ORIENTATION=+